MNCYKWFFPLLISICLFFCHRARRLKDKTPIMTMLFKKAPPGHRTRSREDETVIVMKTENSQVLSYQRMANKNRLELPVVSAF